MAFVDEATIHVVAGAGGDGIVAWHHEPYKPKGGPDGGDGGDGGSVILRADPGVRTLHEVARRPHVKAARGGHGQNKRRHGANAPDRTIAVPVGTVAYDETGVMLADLARPEDQVVVARGGRGGRGNSAFATATRRAPTYSQKGEPGEAKSLRLELRLLADVGLVGWPNAGKSTLISRLSAARPKIADYPFTTLVPNLGVVAEGDESFVIADIPGLVPGAHEGKGLGDRFLRHISRSAVLVLFADLAAADRDPADDVEVLRAELAAFDPGLAGRPQVVVASKVDAGRDRLDAVRAATPDVLAISAVSGEGLDELRAVLGDLVRRSRADREPAVGYVRHVVREEPIRVTREDGSWRVLGHRAELAVARTDLANEDALARLQKRLIAMGVERDLAAAGAVRGDEVRIGDAVFEFEPEADA